MNILLVGSGGREHAIGLKLKESKLTEKFYIAPGNAGTAFIGENINIKADDIDGLTDFACENNIDLVVAGPEVPLCLGLADLMHKKAKEQNKKIAFFGPLQAAAELEASKEFSKRMMSELNIPTAKYQAFDDFDSAKKYIESLDYKFVIKADGLAAGKGVILPETTEEALKTLEEIMLEKRFGDSGNKIVIEERLEGEEVSILAFSDGKDIAVMPSSQDHKRLKNNDEGPNTGGMGAYAPAPICSAKQAEEYAELCIRPIIKKMAENGTPYVGVLYAGLMLTKDGPKVLEYNCRFGDPETQALMQLFDSENADLVKTMQACAEGKLKDAMPKWKNAYAVTVVMASEGYPTSSSPKIQLNKEELKSDENTTVIHAGTALKDGEVWTNGGRVLSITADDADLQKVLDKVYAKIKTISFKNVQYRTDIAKKGLNAISNF